MGLGDITEGERSDPLTLIHRVDDGSHSSAVAVSSGTVVLLTAVVTNPLDQEPCS